jgi:hypothetical protein
MKRAATDIPKFEHLCSLLHLEKFEAMGVLEAIWHFTAKCAPQGDIGKYTDEQIAKWIGWNRRSGQAGVSSATCLIRGLIATGWLDGQAEVDTSTLPRGQAGVKEGSSMGPHGVPWGSSGGPRGVLVGSSLGQRAVSARSLVVHDWFDHADQTVKRQLARQNLDFVRPPSSLPEPEPEPVPVSCAVSHPADTSQPPPPPLPLVTEWPHTETALRKIQPSMDTASVRFIVHEAVRVGADFGCAELCTDAVLAQAVVQAASDRPHAKFPLLKSIVPEVIRSWAKIEDSPLNPKRTPMPMKFKPLASVNGDES